MTLDERDMRGYRRLELSYRPVRSTGPAFQHPLFIAADDEFGCDNDQSRPFGQTNAYPIAKAVAFVINR